MADIRASIGLDSSEATQAIQALTAQIDRLIKLMASSLKLDLKVEKAQAEVEKLSKAVDKAAQSAKNMGNGFSSAVGNALKFTAITGAVTQVSAALDQFLGPFAEFDKQLKNIGTLGVKNFQDFSNGIIDLAAGVPDTVAGVTEAVYNAISAGAVQSVDGVYDVGQALQFVGSASKLAVAGVSDTNSSVKVLAAVTNAYGVANLSASAAADTLFGIVKNGVTTVPELSSSLANVVPAAAALKVPFDQVGAALASLTKKGVGTSEATTKIRAFLGEIAKPGARLQKVLAEANVSLESLQRDGLQATAQKIFETLDKQGKTVQQVFKSIESQGAVLALTGDNAAGAAADLLAMRDAIGSVDSAFAVANTGVGVTVQGYLNQVEAAFFKGFRAIGDSATVAITSINKLAPTVATFASLKSLVPESAIASVKKFSGTIIDATSKVGTQIAQKMGPQISKAFAPLAGQVTKILNGPALQSASAGIQRFAATLIPSLATAGTTATATGGAFTTMWAAITGPVGLAVLAIAAIGAALVVAYTQIEGFKNFVDGVVSTVVEVFNIFVPVFEKIGSLLFEVGAAVFEYMILPFRLAFEIGSQIFSAIGDLIGSFFGSVDDGEDGLDGIRQAAEVIGQVLNAVKASVAGFRAGLSETIAIVGEIAGRLLRLDFSGAAELAGQAGARIGNAVANAARESLNKSNLDDAIENLAEITDAQVEINATLNKATAVETLNKDLQTAQAEIDKLEIKATSGTLSADEQKALDSLQKRAQDYKNKLAEIVPEAVKSVSTSVSATGEFVKSYEVATDKVSAFVDAQRQSVSADITKGQEKYSKNITTIANQYAGQKTQLEQLYKRAEELQSKGDLVGAKKALEEAGKVRTEFQKLGPTLNDAFKKGAEGGLLTEQAIQDVAKAQGISVEEAKKLAGLIKEQADGEKEKKAILEQITGEYERQNQINEEAVNSSRARLLDIRSQIRDNKELTAADRQRLKEEEKRLLAEGKAAVAQKKRNEALEENLEIELGLKEKKKKTDKAASDEEAKRLLDLDKQRAELARRRILDDTERKRQEIRDNEQFAVRELDIERQKVKKSSDLSAKAKESALTSLQEKELLLREKFALDLAEVEAKSYVDALDKAQKERADRLTREAESLQRRIDELENLAVAGSESNLLRLQTLTEERARLLAVNTEREIDSIVSKNEEVKKAQDELQKALATNDADIIADANAALIKARANALNSPAVKAAQDKALRDQRELQRKGEEELASARINAVENTALREREIAVSQAKRTYEERRKAAQGNLDIERQAFNDFLAAKRDAEVAYQKETSAAFRFSLQFSDQLTASIVEGAEERKKQSEAARAEYAKETAELQTQLGKREIDYFSFADKVRDISEKTAVAVESFLDRVLNAFNKAAASSIQPIVDQQRAAFDQQALLYQSNADKTQQIEEQRTQAEAELARARAENNVFEIGAMTAKIADLNAQSARSSEEAAAITSTAFANLGAAAGASFAQLIVSGENAFKALITVALDALDALVPILVAQITGVQLASPNPANALSFGTAGLAAAAGLTALLKGLVALAKSAVSGAFRKGGRVRGGEQTIRVNEEGEEFVANARVTSKYGRFLDVLNRTNSLEQALTRSDLAKKLNLSKLGITFSDEARRGAAVAVAIRDDEGRTVKEMQALRIQVAKQSEQIETLTTEVVALRDVARTTEIVNDINIDEKALADGYRRDQIRFVEKW